APEALELGQGQVPGAALGGGVLALVKGAGPRHRAAAVQGSVDDVRCRVKVAVRVAAHQRTVLGERGVALDDPRPLPSPRVVGLLRVRGELQCRAAMTDGEVGPMERTRLALAELRLQRARVHAVDEIERPWPPLDLLAAAVVAIPVWTGVGGRRRPGDEESQRRGARERREPVLHFTLHLDEGGGANDTLQLSERAHAYSGFRPILCRDDSRALAAARNLCSAREEAVASW